MTPDQLREQTLALALAEPEVRRSVIAKMTWLDVLSVDADYERWVHESQREPSGEGWRTWLLMAGRGFGKTRAGSEWIFKLARARALTGGVGEPGGGGGGAMGDEPGGCRGEQWRRAGGERSSGGGRGLRVRLVHASLGKSARAEPIVLFETGRAFFAGEFPEMEAELAGMIVGGGYSGLARSPTGLTRWCGR